MPWAKIDDNLHASAKFAEVSLGATGLWTLCLSWTTQQLKDGRIPTAIVRRFAGADADALAAELVSAGLWEVQDGGWAVHDYLDYNPSAEEIHSRRERVSEVRSEAGRRSGEVRRSKQRTNDEQKRTKHEQNTNPDPVPVPIPHTEIFSPKPPQPKNTTTDPGQQATARGLPPAVVKALEGHPTHWREALEQELEIKQQEEYLHSPARYLLAVLRGWVRGDNPPEPPKAPVRRDLKAATVGKKVKPGTPLASFPDHLIRSRLGLEPDAPIPWDTPDGAEPAGRQIHTPEVAA